MCDDGLARGLGSTISVSRRAVEPALRERRAERVAGARVLLGLDALDEDARAGALGLRGDGVDDLGDLGVGAALDEREVELDDLGREQRHHRQRVGVGADVVERDRDAHRAHVGDVRQQRGRALRSARAR